MDNTNIFNNEQYDNEIPFTPGNEPTPTSNFGSTPEFIEHFSPDNAHFETYDLDFVSDDVIPDTPVLPDTPGSSSTTVFPDTPVLYDTPSGSSTTVFPDTPVLYDTPSSSSTTVFPDTPVLYDTPGSPSTTVLLNSSEETHSSIESDLSDGEIEEIGETEELTLLIDSCNTLIKNLKMQRKYYDFQKSLIYAAWNRFTNRAKPILDNLSDRNINIDIDNNIGLAIYNIYIKCLEDAYKDIAKKYPFSARLKKNIYISEWNRVQYTDTNICTLNTLADETSIKERCCRDNILSVAALKKNILELKENLNEIKNASAMQIEAYKNNLFSLSSDLDQRKEKQYSNYISSMISRHIIINVNPEINDKSPYVIRGQIISLLACYTQKKSIKTGQTFNNSYSTSSGDKSLFSSNDLRRTQDQKKFRNRFNKIFK